MCSINYCVYTAPCIYPLRTFRNNSIQTAPYIYPLLTLSNNSIHTAPCIYPILTLRNNCIQNIEVGIKCNREYNQLSATLQSCRWAGESVGRDKHAYLVWNSVRLSHKWSDFSLFLQLLNTMLCYVDQHMKGGMIRDGRDELWVVQNNSNNHHELSCWIIPFPFGLWSIQWIALQKRRLLCRSAVVICIHQLYLLNVQPTRTFVGDSDPELDDLEKWMIHGRHLMDFSHL